MNEECLECAGVHTLFSGQREGEREKERAHLLHKSERERERERERKREEPTHPPHRSERKR
jgi:hypothetical protein